MTPVVQGAFNKLFRESLKDSFLKAYRDDEPISYEDPIILPRTHLKSTILTLGKKMPKGKKLEIVVEYSIELNSGTLSVKGDYFYLKDDYNKFHIHINYIPQLIEALKLLTKVHKNATKKLSGKPHRTHTVKKVAKRKSKGL